MTWSDAFSEPDSSSSSGFFLISLLEKCDFLERALEELHKKESKIVDKLVYKEQEVSLSVKLGHLEEGEALYRALLSMNLDNYR
ncbi:N-terminal acetyltransferase A complex auxiliary subunit NAA15 [Glycine max]|nr:N-terminal acetyltransferase A complex auxiliary subunit NAA15 [Glycine max]